jgi:hypothetical protein
MMFLDTDKFGMIISSTYHLSPHTLTEMLRCGSEVELILSWLDWAGSNSKFKKIQKIRFINVCLSSVSPKQFYTIRRDFLNLSCLIFPSLHFH